LYEWCAIRDRSATQIGFTGWIAPCILAHATRADGRKDLVGAQTGSGSKAHELSSDYTTEVGYVSRATMYRSKRHRQALIARTATTVAAA
jgi:hypothetical protein